MFTFSCHALILPDFPRQVLVSCFPFNSIKDALDVKHIDYFSLDVEGPQVEILETVDWKRLQIDFLTIEYAVPGVGPETEMKLNKMRALFNSTNLYREVTTIKYFDVVFERIEPRFPETIAKSVK